MPTATIEAQVVDVPGEASIGASSEVLAASLARPETPTRSHTGVVAVALEYPGPLLILVLIGASVGGLLAESRLVSDVAALAAVLLGAAPLLRDTLGALRRGRFGLDYLALLAILTALFAGEPLVGAVIALMLSSGQALEAYGVRRAKRSLSRLVDRIPNATLVPHPDGSLERRAIDAVAVGEHVLVRHGEVVPLDGELYSERTILDESSLTGEPYLNERLRGDELRSGTVNQGTAVVLRVTRPAGDSTYRRILDLVEQAQASGAPMVRMADRYSAVFTVIAIALAGGAWWWTSDLHRALAVLVVATPCPLILGTPIALLGGVNRGAREKIVVKQLAALEALARVNALILDKTGTLTVGRPELVRVERTDGVLMDEGEALAVAAAVERHSLHPVAKALVEAAHERRLPTLPVSNAHEAAGEGIEAVVDGRAVRIGKTVSAHEGMRVDMSVDGRPTATFVLEDRVKEGARHSLAWLQSQGIELAIATGDRQASAARAVRDLGMPIEVEAECTPAAKLEAIEARQRSGRVVGMVGDGINDAPALARADVGLVFAHEAQTAASEAADVVLLGGEMSQVGTALAIARHAVSVARQGILLGIGLSVVAMVFAAFGAIPPLVGAILQEGIDVLVIANALRATSGGALPHAMQPAEIASLTAGAVIPEGNA